MELRNEVRCRILSWCASRIMEFSQVAVRTRAQAMAMVVEGTADNSGPSKRRKVGNEKLRSPTSTFVQTESLDCEINVSLALEDGPCASCDASSSLRSGGILASCCSSTGSDEKLKVADLAEEETVETETAARYYNLDESERTPSSEFKAESGELDCTTKESSIARHSCSTVITKAEKMPHQAELDEFFAVAQEDVNKRFKDKYNYDIVNDIPLKGRYEWIKLKPGSGNEDG